MTEEAKTSLSSADVLEIMKLLPHRYPFLMVDKIIEIDSDNSAIGIKNVTANEPQFTGHFPGSPIMPGVLLIEGMAQTAGAICARKDGIGAGVIGHGASVRPPILGSKESAQPLSCVGERLSEAPRSDIPEGSARRTTELTRGAADAPARSGGEAHVC